MDKQLIVNNLLVNYSESGAGGGVTLVFLHGWRSRGAVWQSVIADPHLSGYKIYAIDLPGFGKSEIPKRDWHVFDYAGMVAGFMQKLGLATTVLVGHSFGGRIGIKLAASSPELVSKLVLVDSAAFPAAESRKKLFGILAKITRPFFKPAFMQGLRGKIYQKIGAEDYVATPALQKTFVNIVSEDLTEDLRKIKAPTLIVYGQDDTDTPVSFGKKMSSLIPNSKFLVLKQAGHYSFLDQPEQFKGILKDFLQT